MFVLPFPDDVILMLVASAMCVKKCWYCKINLL